MAPEPLTTPPSLMAYLLDANVIIGYLRGQEAPSHILERVFEEPGPPLLSVLTRFEVLRLARISEEKRTRSVFTLFQYADIDVPVVDQAIQYAREFQRKNTGIDVVDYLIAATAKVHRLSLVTYNVKHFPMTDIEVLGRDFRLNAG